MTTRKQLVFNIRYYQKAVDYAQGNLDHAKQLLRTFDEDQSVIKIDRQILFDSVSDYASSKDRYDLFNALIDLKNREDGYRHTIYRDRCANGVSVKPTGRYPDKYLRAFAKLADKVSKTDHVHFHEVHETIRYIFNVVPKKRGKKK